MVVVPVVMYRFMKHLTHTATFVSHFAANVLVKGFDTQCQITGYSWSWMAGSTATAGARPLTCGYRYFNFHLIRPHGTGNA